MAPLRRPHEIADDGAPIAPAGMVTLDRPLARQVQDARSLQNRARVWAVSEALDRVFARSDKWPVQLRVGFILGASAALWGGIITAGWMVIRSL